MSIPARRESQQFATRPHLAAQVSYDALTGACEGVRVGEMVARAKLVIGDPSYFPGKCTNKGKVRQHPALVGGRNFF